VKPPAKTRRATPLKPPATLTAMGREEWLRLAPAAHRAGTLIEASARSFELLTEVLATERAARKLVAENGITVSTARGSVKPHPAVRTMEAARVQAAPLLKLFRLEPPNARAARQPDQPKGKSVWGGVLK
jgi:P27 family predicted phage terminase small subunit